MTQNASPSFGPRLLTSVGFIYLFGLALYIITHYTVKSKISYGSLTYGVTALLLAVVMTMLAQRFWNVGTGNVLAPDRKTILRFLTGLLIGTGLTVAVMFAIGKYSGVTITRNPLFNSTAFARGALAIFILAWAEEISFRGYALSNIRKGAGVWVTQGVIGLCYVLYQVSNGWGFQEAILWPGAWALWYGLSAQRTKGIAQSTGMHFAASLVQLLVGKGAFAYYAITKDLEITADMPDDLRRSGASSQFALIALALVLTAVYAQRVKAGKES
jgi:uncharacterized protein